MGDAQTVAQEMGKIYRPFWAYLAKYTRLLSRGAIAVVALQLTILILTLVMPRYNADAYFDSWEDPGTTLSDYAPTTVANCCGYTISIPRAQFVQQDSGRRCNFMLKAQHLNPWLSNPYFYRNLSAVDDCGNFYGPRQFGSAAPNAPEITGNLAHSDNFVSYYAMWIDDIDPDATTITVIFDHWGEYWEIPMTIEGGLNETVS